MPGISPRYRFTCRWSPNNDHWLEDPDRCHRSQFQEWHNPYGEHWDSGLTSVRAAVWGKWNPGQRHWQYVLCQAAPYCFFQHLSCWDRRNCCNPFARKIISWAEVASYGFSELGLWQNLQPRTVHGLHPSNPFQRLDWEKHEMRGLVQKWFNNVKHILDSLTVSDALDLSSHWWNMCGIKLKHCISKLP